MTRARFDDLRPGRRRSFQLAGLLDEYHADTPADVPPALARAEAAVAAGHWVAGWVSYEAAPAFDTAFVVRPTVGTGFADLPLAHLAVFDRREPVGEPEGDAAPGVWEATIDAGRHAADVEEIRERIRRGDTYQVNHTFRLRALFDGDPEHLYGRLVHAQRGGYGAYLDAGRWAVASASPELFFDREGDRLTCRPMKGTAARGPDTATDEARRAALLASEKDRAENLMIVDMVRNDLGRVAVPGSVGVTELFAVERYDTVWQLTSTVEARTRAGVGLVEVFGPLFPCASITGAPRSSTMRIIAELETTPRGVYCGAIGFGGPTASGPRWAFNVGIRTVLIDRATRTAWYGTGGGITHDSTPAGEYAEALLKAEVLTQPPARFSLLETMLWTPASGIALWQRHLARLTASAGYFAIPLDVAAVRAALDAALDSRAEELRGADAVRLRLLVDQHGRATAEASGTPPPRAEPVRAVIDTVASPSEDPFGRHKTTRRTRYDAAAARHPGADDVILVNELGQVTETLIASLAARVAGRWVTPPLASGCLPGVARAEALASGRLTEASLTPGDLRRADALARLNAVRGWEPLVLDDGQEGAVRPSR
ncbi:MAG: chorismate-binding protein [Actinomycetes bacterium]